MLRLSLKIERVVSDQEAEAIAAIFKHLRPEDVFKIEQVPDGPSLGFVSPEPPSVPIIVDARESKPVKHPRNPCRTWGQRIEDAFNMALHNMPERELDLETLRQAFAWEVKEIDQWEEISIKDLPTFISIASPEEGFFIVRTVLKQLGREPSPTAGKVLLPPEREKYEARIEEEDRKRRERNIKLMGDPYIGPEPPNPGDATVKSEIVNDILSSLDWKSGRFKVMTFRAFFKWADIPFTRGNAVKFGCAARRYGGFKHDRSLKGVAYYKFPLPKYLPGYPED